MAAEEIDVIKHLLDIEREAADKLLEVQKKADEKIAEARSSADARFHERYGSIVKSLESEENSAREKISQDHLSEVEGYKDSLNGTNKNFEIFESLMDRLLFE
ncbi:MAG: hypothetical protein MSS56_01195 [Spirochaetia bacterium]|nr:hypothetical protein [Spirochaetia bacterium]